jgi:guanosine-3',5'-bis(diphosphate) 3'-pyrophosphohydrolase
MTDLLALNDPDPLVAALNFAAKKHAGQFRKTEPPIVVPYINHPIAVMFEISAAGYTDKHILAAAVLHDVLEDTDATVDELDENFGAAITEYVIEVTDDKSLNWRDRKLRQKTGAQFLSAGAQCIRIADKICNIRDLFDTPPPKWTVERRREYVTWACEVVARCTSIYALAMQERFRAFLLSRGLEVKDT